MELKQYQLNVLEKIQKYLETLKTYNDKQDKINLIDPDLGKIINPPKSAWIDIMGEDLKYKEKKNGIGEEVPNFNIKVPTGGGKTLLAIHSIDLINKSYANRKTGFILWIVPTNQIYRQTIAALRNRQHPYRQLLDFSSGGRTEILEKMDRFSPLDINEKLIVMLLMLPSANRQTKETLRIFRDAGGYEAFFPDEDNYKDQIKLLDQFPNLDYFGGETLGMFGLQPKQVKTSLGNVLRLLKPIVIIDEGQKAYSKNAQETIYGFNPSIVVELSATPSEGSNSLVEIKGRELDKEEMIKLDLHVINKSSGDWKDTLLESVRMRDELEADASDYQAQSNRYIRPICLIQVERTGKDQRGKGYIHSEDVRDYLINQKGIPAEKVAVKSSDKDDIEGIDLYSEECPIRYIITKHALQEGWDCSFAYVLTILTNPSSKNGITQLVGRILRQPNAKKTHVLTLDESYVFCFQQKADNLLKDIKKGLEGEGLGDLSYRISNTIHSDNTEKSAERELNVKIRDKFSRYRGKIYLPLFLYQEPGHGWREVSYEMDILSQIDWAQISVIEIGKLSLSDKIREDLILDIGLSENSEDLIQTHNKIKLKSLMKVDAALIARHIGDIVPNPWVAFEITTKTIVVLEERYSSDIIAANQPFIIQELKKLLYQERDRLAEVVFKRLLYDKKIQFLLEEKKGNIPAKTQKYKRKEKKLRHDNDDPIEKSLVEPVLDDHFNGLERPFALALDRKERLLWWYRNISRVDYGIQGWKKNKIYPDIIAAEESSNPGNYETVYVFENKGNQLLGNLDTKYKKDIFELCNDVGRQSTWNALGLDFKDHKFVFQLIPEDKWEQQLNRLFDY